MDFLIYYFFLALSALTLMGWGNIFAKLARLDVDQNYYLLPIYGCFLIGSCTLIIHFIVSINLYIGSLFFLIGLVFFIKEINYRKNIFTSLFIALICFITILFDKVNTPDAPYYHLPYISYLNFNKIIFGLNNLEPRYGYISFLQYISAAFNNLIFNQKALFFPILVIYASSLLFFLNKFLQLSKSLKVLSFLFLIIILIDMNRFSEFGNDEISHMIFFIIVFLLYQSSIKKELSVEEIKIISTLSIFLFLNKGTYILIFILGVYLFFQIIKKKILFDRLILCIFFILIIWLIKNVVVSGCMIFPITFTCIDTLPWSNNEAIFQSLETEAWSKSYPDSNLRQSYEKYISGFNWISIWLKGHFNFILEKTSIVFLFLLIFLSCTKIKKSNFKNIKLNFLLIFLLFCNFFWFLKFPVYRFGSGYLYAFFCVLIAYYFVFDELRLKKFGAIFLILISSLVFLKNFQRVKNQYKKNYIEYPWLKIYSEKDNKKNNFTKIYFKNNSKFFYFYPNGKLCFYSPGICSYKNKNGLQIIVERNYKIIKIK